MGFMGSWIYLNDSFVREKQSVFFRKKFCVDKSDLKENTDIHISADSRYKLYINGIYICNGPLKGDSYRRYYDTVNIAPYLNEGDNVIAVHLLKFNIDPFNVASFLTGPVSLVNSSRGGLFVESDENSLDIGTDQTWKVYLDESYSFVLAKESKYAGDQERCDGRIYPHGWKLPDFDDSLWHDAQVVCPADEYRTGGVLYEWSLKKREIPFLYEKPISPIGITNYTKGIDFNSLIEGDTCIIPPNTKAFVEIDMGELVTAYVNFKFNSLEGNEKVNLLYSESYYESYDGIGYPQKGIRDDYRNGFLYGESDDYITRRGQQEYEPFFFRTFRYLRLTIETIEKPLEINSAEFRLTGYPLDIQGSFSSKEERIQKLWDISIRTLERCMHETYEDCPYYEQTQYAMDTMIQTVLSSQISCDDRLIRRAMLDFHSTQRPDGMINCNAPASFNQIIPGFSICFIDMVYYHYMNFKDDSLLEFYLPTISRILLFFKNKIDKSTGLVKNCGYWEFVDWVDEWRANFGSPIGLNDEYNYIYNLMYCYGLLRAKELYEFAGFKDVALNYTHQHEVLVENINKIVYDEDRGYYRASLQDQTFSQHAQLWAVMSECVTGDDAKSLMERCLDDKNLAKCSYSMSFYLFRALSKAGCYNKSIKLWDSWYRLLDLNITTWPEDPVTQRSECHAWSSLPIYEFTAECLGVKPMNPGYEGVIISPRAYELGDMEANIATSIGNIYVKRKVNLHKAGHNVALDVVLPCETKLIIDMGDGRKKEFFNSEVHLEYSTRGE